MDPIYKRFMVSKKPYIYSHCAENQGASVIKFELQGLPQSTYKLSYN